MKLESPKITLSKNTQSLFELLNNVENFHRIIPDSVADFQILDENSFSFSVSGITKVTLQKKEVKPFSLISYQDKNGSIPILLNIHLHKISENETELHLSFESQLNPMMVMMLKPHLGKFLTSLTEKAKLL